MDKYNIRSEISKLLNPSHKLTLRQTKAIEDLYPSQKRAPLGHAPTPDIPGKSVNMTFGVCSPKESKYEKDWDGMKLSPQDVIDFYRTSSSLIGDPRYSEFKYENDWSDGIKIPTKDVIDCYRTSSSLIGDHSEPKYEKVWSAGIKIPPKDVIDFYRTSSSSIGDPKYSNGPALLICNPLDDFIDFYRTSSSFIRDPKYSDGHALLISNPPEDVIDYYRTSSSSIGDHKFSVSSSAAGLPSYNKKMVETSLKGVSELKEYGDAPTTIQPIALLQHGVFEEDLSRLYSKEQIQSILGAFGVTVSYPAFEVAWKEANSEGRASLGQVWRLLKEECLSL